MRQCGKQWKTSDECVGSLMRCCNEMIISGVETYILGSRRHRRKTGRGGEREKESKRV